MAVTRKKLGENLQRVRDNVAAAAGRVRREPDDVRLVAVTKSVEPETIRTLVELGVRDLGESRVQQLTARAEELAAWLGRRRKPVEGPLRWHMVGHLQRNKVKQVLGAAETIHSVDSLRLAEEIDARAGQLGRTVEVLIEVNCSGESQKFGAAVGAAPHLAEQAATLANLRVVGLMTMAPLNPDPEAARPTFARLREVYDDMIRDRMGGKHFRHLSMGMSQDYTVAVEEGATMIRVGTALFE
jgi:hypothetical protein